MGDFLQKGWCKWEEGFPSGTLLPCCQSLCRCRRYIVYKRQKKELLQDSSYTGVACSACWDQAGGSKVALLEKGLAW